MRTFVITYDRYDSITTSEMLEAENIDHQVFCHTEEARLGFISGGRVKPERLVVTDQPKGCSYNLNAVLEVLDDDEWALCMVDDLIRVTELRNYETAPDPLPITSKNQGVYAERFSHPVTLRHFKDRCIDLAKRCQSIGARLGGFSSNGNAMYRKAHWGRNILVDGRAWIIQRSGLRFDTEVNTLADYAWAAANIERFGTVVVDRWILPECGRYTPGGIGTKEERMEQKIKEAAYLVGRFPSLISYKAKVGWPVGSHIVLRGR